MLNRDFARTSHDIGRVKMVIDQPHIKEQEDWGQVMSQFLKDYKNQQNEQALTDALQSGDQEAIDKAAAAYNPQGFYDSMQRIRASRENFDQQKELLGLRNQYANEAMDKRAALAEKIAQIKAGGNIGTAAQQNIAHLQSMGYSPEQAAAMVFSGQNSAMGDALSFLGKKGTEAYDKKIGEDLANQQIAQRQMTTLQPKAENAIKRARDSLQEGTGLGQIGGMGWTTGQGGINRANVKNAQAQINTAMRGLLKEMGVGSTEMNSALEAEAYRYMISPDMPIEQQEQVLNNFEQDYLSGNLANELSSIYGKQQQTPVDPKILEAIKQGYSLDEINAFLGR